MRLPLLRTGAGQGNLLCTMGEEAQNQQ